MLLFLKYLGSPTTKHPAWILSRKGSKNPNQRSYLCSCVSRTAASPHTLSPHCHPPFRSSFPSPQHSLPLDFGPSGHITLGTICLGKMAGSSTLEKTTINRGVSQATSDPGASPARFLSVPSAPCLLLHHCSLCPVVCLCPCWDSLSTRQPTCKCMIFSKPLIST